MSEEEKKDPLKPSLNILMKLGSIAVHADEIVMEQPLEIDRMVVKNLLEDKELQEWMKDMNEQGLLPVKR